jgi:hypothetical protein
MRVIRCLGASTLLLASLLGATATLAQPTTEPTSPRSVRVDATDAAAIAANQDKEVLLEGVCGKAEWSNTGSVLTIEFKGVPRRQFSAVAFQRLKERLDRAFMGDAAKNFTGSKLRIRGRISEFRGNLQIVIGDPSQVTVVEPAASGATKPTP